MYKKQPKAGNMKEAISDQAIGKHHDLATFDYSKLMNIEKVTSTPYFI